jgi:hypothetical protein
MVGHIEDIAVAKDQQGKKLGLRIIQALDAVAEAVGCYKVSVQDLFAILHEQILNGTDRVFSTAPKQMKDSMSSADTNALVLKWHTTMEEIRGGCRWSFRSRPIFHLHMHLKWARDTYRGNDRT